VKLLRLLYPCTALLHSPPLILYGAARISGVLPDQEVWEARGGNHGPWYCEPQGDLLTLFFLGQLLLLPVTLLIVVGAGKRDDRGRTLTAGLLLLSLQFVLLWCGGAAWFWTID
jgi:hypothetical protein